MSDDVKRIYINGEWVVAEGGHEGIEEYTEIKSVVVNLS
jgi:hypothetical protein